MKILIINGPNLNLLGKREVELYGNETLKDFENWLNDQTFSEKVKCDWFQSNHEGILIDTLHERDSIYDGIVLNPGALTHYSYSLKDAVRSINTPVIEFHLTNIKQRENFRKISVIEEDCVLTIIGDGKKGYLKAIDYFLNSKK